MKNRILDLIGFIVVIYMLSLGFVILFIQIFESGLIVIDNGSWLSFSILFIRPIPYAFTIYLYYATKELKRSYNKNMAVYEEDRKIQDSQIANYKLLGEVRVQRIRKLEEELVANRKEIIALKDTVDGVDQFNKIFKDNEEIFYDTFREIDEVIEKPRLKTKEGQDLYSEIKPILKEILRGLINDPTPFTGDTNSIIEAWTCPECNSEMTRQTAKTVFCDNPSCQRKQWKKCDL